MKKLLTLTIYAITTVAIAAGVFRTQFNAPRHVPMLKIAKGGTYDSEWKKVDSLINLGLSRSALDQVEKIYKKAKADNNAAQIVKSLMFRLRLVQQFEEDDVYKSIYNMNDEIKNSSYPLTPILHSMLADIYQQYYSRNMYKFSQRTQVVNVKMDDISTWDLKTLFDQIIKHHVAALQNADSLKRTPLNIYDDVITQGTSDTRKLRPTLYDFIAHRALTFLMNDEPDVIRPAYKFELNSEDYFKSYDVFSKLSITSNDTLSTKYYATRILQGLLAFHANDTNPAALIDDDLIRLDFVRKYATTGINDSLYLSALQALEQRFRKWPSSTEVTYEIAKYYSDKGNAYDGRKSENNKWLEKKAMEICRQGVARFSNSYGAEQCKALEITIKEKNMSFNVEKANAINKPFKAYLTYKNLSKLYARIVPVSFEKYMHRYNDYYYSEGEKTFLKEYIKATPTKEWSFTVPNDSDYQTHYLEFKIPELAAGFYVILLSDNEKFSLDNEAVAFQGTWVSNLSFIDRRTSTGGYEFYVLDRETGNPLKNVTANLWYYEYNYNNRKYEYKLIDSKVSDEQGSFQAMPKKDYSSFDVELINGNDHYRTDDNSLYMYRESQYAPQMETRTTLFTDRAIYRPGQTIYFKGIMISTDGKKSEILPNHSSTVTFYDVNYQKISSLEVKTNEYGSYSGTFTAPNGVLNGNMSITDGYGTVSISVEDYKRPKFEVVFNPVKGSYRLNDSVKIGGTAKAYSGANIDGAQVKYRVVRGASFPYWWYYWWGYYPSSPEMEVTNGVTVTNDTGGYFVHFKAMPDMAISRSMYPTYTYTIYADVTDINGETHSSQTYVMAAYNALNLSVDIPDEVNKDKEQKFTLATTNMNGNAEPAEGNIEIYKLKDPAKIFRKREWEKPDKFIMSKDEYCAAFPNDEYDDENNMYKWDRGDKVYTTSFNTDKSKELTIEKLSSWQPGIYVMEAHTKDKYGEDVKDVKYFTLFSEKGKEMPNSNLDWFSVIQDNGEPGETASFLIGSKENDVKVLYEIEEQNKSLHKEWLTLNSEQKRIDIPILERHRGNFSVHFVFVKDGRQFSHDALITVPWTNKELDLKFETFRNKLLPGEKEEWKIKIKDKKGDKVMAEMMATLYDASLDAFRANYWAFDIYNHYYSSLNWDNSLAFGTKQSQLYSDYWNEIPYYPGRSYDALNWFGYYYYYYGYYYDYEDNLAADGAPVRERAAKKSMYAAEEKDKADEDYKTPAGQGAPAPTTTLVAGNASVATTHSESQTLTSGSTKNSESGKKGSDDTRKVDLSGVAARTNFNETAFFYPQLETDSTGSVIVKFTVPEALTRWKMMGLAFTKDLKIGQIANELVTQKELMVVPNAPRFFRENDTIEFTSKITNLSEKDLTGNAQLMLYDAITMKPLDLFLKGRDGAGNGTRTFSAKKGLSTNLSWTLVIPEGIGAITYKVVAKADNYSDGEEMALPVLTNRMLVTESMPLPIRGMQTKNFHFEKLISQNGGSTTLRNYKLTLEFTANPAWYAVQALPYIMEYPYECAEQTFARFYANSIASHIANSSPKIKAVFDSWKNQSPDALLSNLEKNQELKSLMLEETPWVLDAKDETERKHRVALLFDLNRMSNELDRALNKLEKMQVSNGGWPWFDGMPDDRYITQYIITGMGHLDHLGVKNVREDSKVWNMVKKGVQYLDDRIREDYEEILRYGNPDLDNLGYEQIQYLYARSYFKDISIRSRDQKAFDYFKGQEQQYWLSKGRYMQGMIALALNRYDDKVIPGRIMKSLKENSISNEEMGMYWKENYDGFYWWEAPIECQALLIEAFDEVAHDQQSVDDLKVWLLKSKQTQNWQTTKATTEACYALLLRGTDWLATESNVEITLGNTKIDPKNMPDVKQQAGTGYFKTSWSGSDIKPEMGNVTVVKKDQGVSWGALYWQYFEQLDKITPAKTPLQLVKKLFIEENTASGPVLQPIDSKTHLKVGNKVKVRIELRVDRDMQYVHMKDMRASGFEPMNVISQYMWQDGLGYYESTRDAATNFFISYLHKGTYVFEYPLRVTHKGNFSNGITSIQCMYAPEFASHSEGIRVSVTE